MNITAKTNICMVIGDPIHHSLSPQIHNAGYEALGIENEFVYVACNVPVNQLKKFVQGVRAMGIRGVSCTIPHKIEIMKYLDEVDEVAKKIGAVNTIVNDEGVLKGSNTDWLGAIKPLEKITYLKNNKVALIGAGGAARAIAYGVTQRGAKLFVFNRTLKKAQELAKEFNGEAYSLKETERIKEMDIIINATSVGLTPHDNESPIPKDSITKEHIVFDAIYRPMLTTLLKDAKEKGAHCIHGFEMLLQQAIPQFQLYTGHKAPEEGMRKALLSNLKG